MMGLAFSFRPMSRGGLLCFALLCLATEQASVHHKVALEKGIGARNALDASYPRCVPDI